MPHFALARSWRAEEGQSLDMASLHQRIEDIVRVLANFSDQREPGRYGFWHCDRPAPPQTAR